MADSTTLKDIISRNNPIKLERLVNEAYKQGIGIVQAYKTLKGMLENRDIVEYKGNYGTYYLA
jgi:aryl-phospho-beta-D-glucosidase BglC (GH1 family)